MTTPKPSPSGSAAKRQEYITEEWTGRERRLVEHFAIAMHAMTSGDWGAAGHDTKQRFRVAAAFAVASLNKDGLDLLDILPKGAQGRV